MAKKFGGLDKGTQRVILTPITREYIQGLRGRYKGKGLLKALVAEKKRERERELPKQ